MTDAVDGSDQLLELERRGLELATREAELRRSEINAILSSRRVLLTAERDPSVRETRVAILEELAHASYPNATVLAAARHLAAESGHQRIRRPHYLPPRPRVRGLRHILGGTAALALCIMAVAGVLTARAFERVDDGQVLTVLLTCLPFVAFVAGIVGAWSARHGAGWIRKHRTPGWCFLLAGAAWVTALTLLVSGAGESALGAHFASGVLLVWSAFVAVSSFTAARWAGRRRTPARARSAGSGSRRPLVA